MQQQQSQQHKRPKILLYSDTFQGRVGISEPYMTFLSQFGEVILISPLNDFEFFLEHGDVLAMPGGADIDTSRYNERPFVMNRTNPYYEYLDTQFLPKWIETGKPIIGICRGMQSLNVALGGKLYQDIRGHVQGTDRHVTREAMFTDIKGFEIHQTNSFHHQAVKTLGRGLSVIGWSELYSGCPAVNDRQYRPKYRHTYFTNKSGEVVKRTSKVSASIPEIIKHDTLPYIGFQYHPEEFNCDLAIMLINHVVFGKPLKQDIDEEQEESYHQSFN